MKSSRTVTREKAMTILYQIFLYNKNNINYVINDVISELLEDMTLDERKKIDIEFLNKIVNGALEHILEINDKINSYLDNWRLDRLGLTDQAILTIAVYELIYTDTPDLVCINEAIELSKKYSDDKVSKMINGVLDKIYHERLDNEQ